MTWSYIPFHKHIDIKVNVWTSHLIYERQSFATYERLSGDEEFMYAVTNELCTSNHAFDEHVIMRYFKCHHRLSKSQVQNHKEW